MRASVTFDLGGAGSWGLFIESGRAAVGTPPTKPDVTIHTSPQVLSDIIRARRPGYDAFLAGQLEVRGNLSLALELESFFEPLEPAPPGWPQTVRVRVGRLRWSILTAGPPEATPVLLLHGLGGTKASFLPTFADISKDFRVYACDLPGFGDSSKPVAPYNAPWFGTCVLDLMDELEIKEAGLVGNSMGGRIALEVGMRAPDRCRGLVLLAPALAFLRYRQAAPFVRFARPEFGVIPVGPTRRMVFRLLRAVIADRERVPRQWVEAAVDEFLRVHRRPRGRLAFYSAARHIYLDEPYGELGFWQRLKDMDVTAQFVFGRLDPLIPVAFAKYVAEALPDARIAIFDGCGHVPQVEQPERTSGLIRTILA